MFQYILVLAILVICIGLIVRAAIRIFQGKDSGCSLCDSCNVAPPCETKPETEAEQSPVKPKAPH